MTMDLTRGQKLLVLAGLTLALAGLLVLSFSRGAPPVAPVVYHPGPAQQPPQQRYVAVHVVGAVSAPGMYWLPSSARAAEAVAAAGGFAPEADHSSLNLAAPLQDGQQLCVATKRLPAPAPSTAPAGAPALPAPLPKVPQQQVAAPAPQLAAAAVQPAAPSIVSLNAATKPQLEALPGIGPELAARILYYRYEHGPFRSVEDLLQVEGIGRERLEAIRPFIRP